MKKKKRTELTRVKVLDLDNQVCPKYVHSMLPDCVELILAYGMVFVLILAFHQSYVLNWSVTLQVPIKIQRTKKERRENENPKLFQMKKSNKNQLTFMYRVVHTTELLFLWCDFSSLDGNWNRVLFNTNARGTFCDDTGVENITWAPFKWSLAGASSSDKDLHRRLNSIQI